MSRIAPIDRQNPSAAVASQLAAVKAKLGMVPNLFATFAQSPVALNAYLALSDAVTHGGILSVKDRERIALAVGQVNGCDYCLSAHTLMGQKAGLSGDEVLAARRGEAGDVRAQAIISLARAIVSQRGLIDDAALEAARAAGLTDATVLEVLAVVVVNLFTNYANHIAGTEIDFPKAPALAD